MHSKWATEKKEIGKQVILGKICQTVKILKNFSRIACAQTYLVR